MNEIAVANEENKPAKGRGGKYNFPNARKQPKTEEEKAEVQKILAEVLTAYRQPKVKSDEELIQRLSDYFSMCVETGQIPTVEEMALYTGYATNTIWKWETGESKGFSEETRNILKKAKDFLKTFDGKMAVTGKMNFLAYCFRAKNYYGMVDKQEHVLTPNNPLEQRSSAEDISRLIETNIPEE